MTIGERIKNRRKELHLSQEELGKRLGVTKSAICNVERDKEQNLTTDRVEKFAKALNCTEAYLMGWTKENSEERSDALMRVAQDAYRQKRIDLLPPEALELLDDYIDLLVTRYVK